MTRRGFPHTAASKIQEKLLEVSKAAFPALGHGDIDAKIAEAFAGTSMADADDAKELAEWVQPHFDLQLDQEYLTGVTQDEAREYLWNAFDDCNIGPRCAAWSAAWC